MTRYTPPGQNKETKEQNKRLASQNKRLASTLKDAWAMHDYMLAVAKGLYVTAKIIDEELIEVFNSHLKDGQKPYKGNSVLNGLPDALVEVLTRPIPQWKEADDYEEDNAEETF